MSRVIGLEGAPSSNGRDLPDFAALGPQASPLSPIGSSRASLFRDTDEASTLQTEIVGLRKANEILLSRLRKSGMVSSGPVPGVDSTTCLSTDDKKSHLELRERVNQLSDKYTTLLASCANVQATTLPTREMNLDPSLSEDSLLKDRDSMWEQLCSEERSRADMARQANVVESKLAKAQSELKDLGSPRNETPVDVSGLVEEAQQLRSKIASLRAVIQEKVVQMRKRSHDIDECSRSIQSVGCDTNSQVLQHNALLKDVAALRMRIESSSVKLQTANASVDALRSDHASADRDMRAAMSGLDERVQDYMVELHCKDASLKVSESALASARTLSLERKGALAALRSAHDDIIAKSQVQRTRSQQEASTLQEKIDKAISSNNCITREITERECELKVLQVHSQRHSILLAEATQALAQEQSNVSAASERITSLHSKISGQVECLTQQLRREQAQAPRLAREISEATIAAGWQANKKCHRRAQIHDKMRHGCQPAVPQRAFDSQVHPEVALSKQAASPANAPLESRGVNSQESVEQAFRSVDALLAKRRKPLARFSYLAERDHPLAARPSP